MFLLGAMGTGHCLGMCGPLVFAFPGSAGRFSAHLWYHAGRIGTYTLVGALLGLLSQKVMSLSSQMKVSPLLQVLNIQLMLSIFAAIFLLVFGLARFGLIREPEWMTLISPEKIPGMNRLLKAILVSPKGPKLMVLGGILGFIPCGLSYAAFARALPSGSGVQGALILFMFGLGTLPGLLLLGTGLSKIFRRYQSVMELLAGLLMIAMAVKMLLNALTALL